MIQFNGRKFTVQWKFVPKQIFSVCCKQQRKNHIRKNVTKNTCWILPLPIRTACALFSFFSFINIIRNVIFLVSHSSWSQNQKYTTILYAFLFTFPPLKYIIHFSLIFHNDINLFAADSIELNTEFTIQYTWNFIIYFAIRRFL